MHEICVDWIQSVIFVHQFTAAIENYNFRLSSILFISKKYHCFGSSNVHRISLIFLLFLDKTFVSTEKIQQMTKKKTSIVFLCWTVIVFIFSFIVFFWLCSYRHRDRGQTGRKNTTKAQKCVHILCTLYAINYRIVKSQQWKSFP